MASDNPSDQRELSPTEAAERFIARRENKNSEKTVRSYRHRLSNFLLWADQRGLQTMRELDGWLVDEYHRYLEERGDAPTTIKSKISALSQLVEYCETLEVVEEGFSEKIELPSPSMEEATSDEMLTPEDAAASLAFFRDSVRKYGTHEHVILELVWHIGGRISCFRALDLDDWHPEERTLEFRHRPPTELKDGEDHERNVLVSETVADVLDFFINRERADKRDDNGRMPLLTTNQGRASESSIRCWAYQATQPCYYMECPHNRDRKSCEYTHRGKSSRCPSSRSPHAIRTGSITWQLNRGLSYVKVAKRVAAAPETIRRYYDKPDLEDELERRRDQTENLDILTEEDDENDD